MGRSLGRALAPAAAALLLLSTFASKPALVSAQDEEVIEDPELSGGASTRGSNTSSEDEVIADPELGGGSNSTRTTQEDDGWGDVYKPKSAQTDEPGPVSSASAPEEPDPMANTGIAKLEVTGQTALDVHPEGKLEDFYEARLRFGGEVDFRISRRLRLSIGTRIDFAWYAPWQNDPDLNREQLNRKGEPIMGADGKPVIIHHTALQEDRYEVDIIPLSAYVDATVADGVHLRIGEQVVSLARMDGMSVTDMLAVLDFRPQSKMDLASLKLAQPAMRLDWDFNSWATLQLVYVPWFMPHLVRGNRDNYVARAVGSGSTPPGEPAAISQLIDPSYQARTNEVAMRFVGPAPDFRNPQAEARMNFRGNGFELALLGGTALEKLPAVYYTPLANTLLLGPNESGNQDAYGQAVVRAAELTAAGNALVDVEYHRYYLMGFDGSFDLAPMQVGFEFGYSPSRHLYASDLSGTAGTRLPLPDVSPEIADADDERFMTAPTTVGLVTDRSIRKGTQMLQGALHLEYLKGESLLLAAEGYVYQALSLPHDKTRQWLGFPKDKGTYVAGFVAGSYNIQEGKYRFDLSMMVMMGPSFMLTPQIEFQIVESFYLNIGAQFYEGPTPNNLGQARRTATNLTPGGMLSGYDNVYLGFRWLP